MHPETARKGVLDHRADVGIALDGDADRVVMIDENAQVDGRRYHAGYLRQRYA